METKLKAMDQRALAKSIAQVAVEVGLPPVPFENSPSQASTLPSRSRALDDYEMHLQLLEHQNNLRQRQLVKLPPRAPLDPPKPVAASNDAATYQRRLMLEAEAEAMTWGDCPLPRSPPLTERLEVAVQAGDIPAVKDAFEAVRNHDLSIPPVQQGYGRSLGLAIEHQHSEVLRYLLSQGLEPNMSNVRGAIRTKNKAILQLLFEKAWGITKPLGWHDPPALAFVVEDAELTAWFLAHGADPNAASNGGETPLQAAVIEASFSVVKMMFANGADAKAADLLHDVIGRKHGDRQAMVEYLIQNGALVNAKHHHSQPLAAVYYHYTGLGTPLHQAATRGDEEMLRILISHGAKLDIKDTNGRLAVDLAERMGHENAVQYLRQQQALARL